MAVGRATDTLQSPERGESVAVTIVPEGLDCRSDVALDEEGLSVAGPHVAGLCGADGEVDRLVDDRLDVTGRSVDCLRFFSGGPPVPGVVAIRVDGPTVALLADDVRIPERELRVREFAPADTTVGRWGRAVVRFATVRVVSGRRSSLSSDSLSVICRVTRGHKLYVGDSVDRGRPQTGTLVASQADPERVPYPSRRTASKPSSSTRSSALSE